MSVSRRSQRLIMGLVGVCAVTISACGGSDGDGASTTSSTVVTASIVSTSSTTTTTIEEVAEPEVAGYEVQPGDTLSSIASSQGVGIDELIAANSLTNPDLLAPGDVLTIPGEEVTAAKPPAGDSTTTTVAPAGTGQTYTVQPGDVLLAIANRFDVTVEALVDANNLENADAIRDGQVLQIPSSA